MYSGSGVGWATDEEWGRESKRPSTAPPPLDSATLVPGSKTTVRKKYPVGSRPTTESDPTSKVSLFLRGGGPGPPTHTPHPSPRPHRGLPKPRTWGRLRGSSACDRAVRVGSDRDQRGGGGKREEQRGRVKVGNTPVSRTRGRGGSSGKSSKTRKFDRKDTGSCDGVGRAR